MPGQKGPTTVAVDTTPYLAEQADYDASRARGRAYRMMQAYI